MAMYFIAWQKTELKKLGLEKAPYMEGIMHYTIKVYKKDGSVLYTLNTTDPCQARSHYYGAAKMNKEVSKTECYMEGELIGTRE